MQRLRFFPAFFFLFLPPILHAQPTSLPLDSVWAYVRRSHPIIKAARAEVSGAEAEKTGLSVRFPNLPEMDASMMRVMGGRLYSLTIGGMHTLELRNQVTSRRTIGEAKVAMAQQVAQGIIQKQYAEVRRSYLQAAFAQEKQILLRIMAAEAKQLHDALKERFRMGQAAGFDVTMAALDANRADIAVRQAEIQTEKARRALTLVAEMELGPHLKLVVPAMPTALPDDTQLVEIAWQTRAELKQLTKERDLTTGLRLLSYQNKTPNLQIGAFFALDNTYLDRFTPVVGLRAAMPLPIRNAGWYNNGTAEINRLDHELERINFLYEAQKEKIRNEVLTASTQYRLLVETLQLAQVVEASLAESMAQTEAMYREKRIDVIQYLAQRTRQHLVKIEHMELMQQAILAYAEAELATGLLPMP